VKNPTLIMTLALALLVAGCGDRVEQQAVPGAESAATTESAPAAAPAAQPDVWRGKVAETMDAGGYTYVLLDSGSEQRWVAGPVTAVTVGEDVMMMPGMEMRDFASKTLDRTFDVIYFVAGIEPDDGHGHLPGAGTHESASPHGGGTPVPDVSGAGKHMNAGDAMVEGVEKLAGGVTVAELHERTADLAGQPVKLRGRVVKFTPNIMGTNWAHIQDGTGVEGSNDLTVTTDAVLQVGDLVLIEGTLVADRDFGAGYRYAVIIEGADVTKE